MVKGSRRVVKHRISARVLPAFYNRFTATMKVLGLTQERNSLREEVCLIAKRLCVPAAAVDCIQQIAVLEQKLETTADKLSVVVEDRDALQSKCDEYKQARDCFKSKYETATADLSVVKAKLLAYQRQGFWGRLFRRVPVVAPYAET